MKIIVFGDFISRWQCVFLQPKTLWGDLPVTT